MINTIPLLPFPYSVIRKIVHGFYPLSSILVKFFPTLDFELEESEIPFSGKEYLGGAILAFTFYFITLGGLLAIYAHRNHLFEEPRIRVAILLFSLIVSGAIFFYILLVPKWLFNKKKLDMEKNLFFATRHLMVQTSAGVPLFDAIVSISENYPNDNLNYGAISREFKKIANQVRGGMDLGQALEISAERNPSYYYKRVIWQLTNAHKSGGDVGFLLREMINFLSNEQRILIRNYGSQLNPLALFYMFLGVIAPTMGLIFLSLASTILDLPINALTFILVLVGLLIIQIMFIGLIKSRRPSVVL